MGLLILLEITEMGKIRKYYFLLSKVPQDNHALLLH